MTKTRIQLGRISKYTIALGGYQDRQFGLHVEIESRKDNWFIGSGQSYWCADITPTENAEWDESDRDRDKIGLLTAIETHLAQAKVANIGGMIGIPVEVTVTDSPVGSELVSWRILEEVL